MKTTKAGITIYEDSDKLPDDFTGIGQCMQMINLLRIEINKMAVIIDDLQQQIDELKSRT